MNENRAKLSRLECQQRVSQLRSGGLGAARGRLHQRDEGPTTTIALRVPAIARRTLSEPVAYALSAAIIGLALFASATPSPLYATYSRLWGFSSVVLTLVYATYAIGVLVALLLAGRASDVAGRRPLLLIALGALIASSVLYILAASVVWLLAARAVQGLATGLALATASAGLLDFHPRRDAEEVGLTNGSVSAAGLAFGALVSAAAVQLLPAPRVLPYALVLALFAIAFVGVLLMPEPVVDRAPLRLTPQRPRVPAEVRQPFVLAALAVAAAYSIGGLFFALGPQLSAEVFATGNHLLTAASLVLLAGVGSMAQLAYGRRAAWAAVTSGSVVLAAGVGLIALAAAEKAPVPLLIGSAVGGAGFGVAFLGALRNLSAAIPPDHRAEIMSAFFLVAYSALSVPAVLAGLAATRLSLTSTFAIFGAAVAALALVVARQAWRTRPGRASRTAQPCERRATGDPKEQRSGCAAGRMSGARGRVCELTDAAGLAVHPAAPPAHWPEPRVAPHTGVTVVGVMTATPRRPDPPATGPPRRPKHRTKKHLAAEHRNREEQRCRPTSPTSLPESASGN